MLFRPLPNEDGRMMRLWPSTDGGRGILTVTLGGPIDLFTDSGTGVWISPAISGGYNIPVVAALAPNEDRLTTGPVGLLICGSPLVYDPELGIGKNVGVAGREVGVGIELVVDTVLVLSLPP